MISRSPTRGFTLIEVLVALAMFSILSIAMIATFRFGQRSYVQIVEHRRGDSDVVLTQRFLRQSLESLYPLLPSRGVTSRGLEGRAQSARFTALSPGRFAVGHYRYEVSLRSRRDSSFDLVVHSEVDRDGRAVAEGSNGDEVLIERVAALRWFYLESDVEGRSSTTWLTSWELQELPKLIRLVVEFPSGDVRFWPQLVIAPRITDNARCDFDVVSQVCRGGNG